MLIQDAKEATQNPSRLKEITRIEELKSALIQKVLIGLVGAAAINSISDDGYNDNVPPVITINGDNPATVELGATYSDAGATANDAFHGETAVTSATSDVDVTAVGTYTITYIQLQI